MIERITLKNFQSHKETEIEFVEGINVLAGTSSHGKTAVLRGLSWVLDNKPDGKGFVSYWNRKKNGDPHKETSAEVIFKDCTIKRLKEGTNNHYILNGEVLTTVGRGVPPEVEKAHNMSLLNVHKQLDPPFLLSMTPGDVAKYLNSLVNLELIDSTLSNANAELRGLASSVKHTTEEITELEKELSRLTWVERAEELCAKMEEIKEDEEAMDKEYLKLMNELEAYQRYSGIVSEMGAIITDAVKRINFIEKNEVKVVTDTKEISKAVADLKSLEQWNHLVESYKKVVGNALDMFVNVDAIEHKIKALETELEVSGQHVLSYRRVTQMLDVGRVINRAEVLLEKESTITVNGKEIRKHIESAVDQLEKFRTLCIAITSAETDLQEAIGEMPDVCPTCGQPWSHTEGCV